MTAQPAAAPLHLSTAAEDARTLRVAVRGDLDYDTAEELLEAVDAGLTAYPGTRELRLDCGGLSHCDSMGLSVLLTVHRRTSAAGIRLRLDDRPQPLDRLLDVTGTLEFLTADPADPATQAANEQDPRPEAPADSPELQSRRPSAGPPNT
jgi:anti-anti-sigma factor